jgi:hypothetical protein
MKQSCYWYKGFYSVLGVMISYCHFECKLEIWSMSLLFQISPSRSK